MLDDDGKPITITSTKYTATDEAKNILFNGFATLSAPNSSKVYRLTDGNSGDDLKKFNLAHKDFYFAENTTIYIVVRITGDTIFNLHTLGMNPLFNLEPIFEPTSYYISLSSAAPTAVLQIALSI